MFGTEHLIPLRGKNSNGYPLLSEASTEVTHFRQEKKEPPIRKLCKQAMIL